RNRSPVCRVEPLEGRALLASTDVPGTPPLAIVLDLSAGALAARRGILGSPADVEVFRVDLPADGLLSARLEAPGLPVRLSLLDGQGQPPIQSDGRPAADPYPLIAQHVAAGTYFFRVEDRGDGTGMYLLLSTFEADGAPSRGIPVPDLLSPTAIGDLDGD